MKPSFLLCGALFLTGATARAQDIYRTYVNPRFGTVVRYPSNLVAPQPESPNGDGRKFQSRDGQIELTTYAARNLARRSAGGEMNRAVGNWKSDGARLTYARYGASWFVLSGFLGADIFYEKTLLQNGVFHTLIWQYPQQLKKRLDPAVSRSAAAFSVAKSRSNPTPAPTATAKPRATPRPRSKKRPVQPAAAGY